MLARRALAASPTPFSAVVGPLSSTTPESTSMSQRAQRLIEAARKLPVPEGTYAVGLGLLISGHHRLRLPDPGVQGPHQVRVRRPQRPVDPRVRRRARLLPARSSRRSAARSPTAAPASSVADRSSARRRGRAPSSPARSWSFSIVGVRRVRAHRAALPRPGGPARLLRDRARHLRGAAHHPGHAVGQRALRSLRDDPRRRGHLPHPAGDRAVRRRDRRPRSGTASRSRSRRCSRSSSRCGASTGSWSRAPTPWSELSTNLTLLFLGSLAAQALSYAAALGVLVLAQGKHRAQTPRPTSSSGSSSPASRSCCSRRSRPRCCPKLAGARRARASTTTSARACRSSC